jgi:KUP system potassium uptake protein
MNEARAGYGGATAAVGALGVVFGDIGTSPLYAFAECFRTDHPGAAEVLGVFSLVFWALVLVVCVKYLVLILRADNQGEGGILALLALLRGPEPRLLPAPSRLALLGLFGAALLYGDGLITPAISVLSAVEGIEELTPALSWFVVPITVAILFFLFRFQRHGTAGIASVFGPTMLVWFVTIGVLGLGRLLASDTAALHVLHALDPRYGIATLTHHGLQGFAVVGSLVLVVTGAEALYADLGHFGARPIRRAWYWVVFPSLVLNYAGQAALVLERGRVGPHPFYDLAPDWALIPLVVLSTVATIIASQALISGVFSLTQQASQLGYFPRFRVVHTSDVARGQIYLPEVNAFLAAGCILVVVVFRSSDALAAAYGVAVTGTMVVTSILFFTLTRRRWGWSLLQSVAVVAALLVVDLGFLAGNLDKIASGGWLPIAVALALFTVMTTWARGRRELANVSGEKALTLDDLLAKLRSETFVRVPGTALYWTLHSDDVPPVLARNLAANRVLHERIVLLTVLGAEPPRVRAEERASVVDLGSGLLRAIVLFGFAERPTLACILEGCAARGLRIDPNEAVFFLGRHFPLPSGASHMATWRKRLFAVLSRNSPELTSAYEIPPERAVEIGLPVRI